MPKPTSSGIQTSADGQAFIPSSRRADGSTRKEIKVRPGYKPPEDVETYKSRNAEAWRTKGPNVPGAEAPSSDLQGAETKSKNAKRREAMRRKKEQDSHADGDDLTTAVAGLEVQDPSQPSNGIPDEAVAIPPTADDQERQKKIRNQLKRLRAVRDLKAKKAAGEKLSTEQLVKISKEEEIVRDLRKLDYDGTELVESDETEPRELSVS